jgi:hypothetical protein
MPEGEAHPIVAEEFYQLFDQSCQHGLENPLEKGPTLALFAVALTIKPEFEESGLPKSWSEFAKRHPDDAALLRQGAKDLQVPGYGRLNPIIPKECTPRGIICHILNPIYLHGLALNSVEQRAAASEGEPGRILFMPPVPNSSGNKHTENENEAINISFVRRLKELMKFTRRHALLERAKARRNITLHWCLKLER